jgi:hypothetical protein
MNQTETTPVTRAYLSGHQERARRYISPDSHASCSCEHPTRCLTVLLPQVTRRTWRWLAGYYCSPESVREHSGHSNMEQSPFTEADSGSANQTHCILRNTKLHYRVQKSLPVKPAPCSYILASYLFRINSVLSSPVLLIILRGLFAPGFPTKIWHAFILSLSFDRRRVRIRKLRTVKRPGFDSR